MHMSTNSHKQTKHKPKRAPNHASRKSKPKLLRQQYKVFDSKNNLALPKNISPTYLMEIA